MTYDPWYNQISPEEEKVIQFYESEICSHRLWIWFVLRQIHCVYTNVIIMYFVGYRWLITYGIWSFIKKIELLKSVYCANSVMLSLHANPMWNICNQTHHINVYWPKLLLSIVPLFCLMGPLFNDTLRLMNFDINVMLRGNVIYLLAMVAFFNEVLMWCFIHIFCRRFNLHTKTNVQKNYIYMYTLQNLRRHVWCSGKAWDSVI